MIETGVMLEPQDIIEFTAVHVNIRTMSTGVEAFERERRYQEAGSMQWLCVSSTNDVVRSESSRHAFGAEEALLLIAGPMVGSTQPQSSVRYSLDSLISRSFDTGST